MNEQKITNLWNRAAHFFEQGDLTPIAVLISIAHYGPVLVAHGENWFVAWSVGALIDLLHFRSVRKVFQSHRRNAIIGHALVACITTLMAIGYHVRFYAGDLLLALPIPIGVAILAQHAAGQQTEQINISRTHRQNRVHKVIAAAKKWKALANQLQNQLAQLQADSTNQQTAVSAAQETIKELQTQVASLQNQVNTLQTNLTTEQTRANQLQARLRDAHSPLKAWQKLNPETQTLALFLSGELSAEQAADKIGVRDARTVQNRAARLNGVAKD